LQPLISFSLIHKIKVACCSM